MASRPTGRTSKTGMTTRKRNLLLRAAGLYGGTFRASGNMLMAVNRKTGRALRGNYYLLREDLRRNLERFDQELPVEGIRVLYNNRAGMTSFGMAVAPGEIVIGCKRFLGKNAEALREWATKKD